MFFFGWWAERCQDASQSYLRQEKKKIQAQMAELQVGLRGRRWLGSLDEIMMGWPFRSDSEVSGDLVRDMLSGSPLVSAFS